MSALSSTEARAGDAPIAVIAESLSWDLSGGGRAAIRGYVPRDDSPSQAARYAGAASSYGLRVAEIETRGDNDEAAFGAVWRLAGQPRSGPPV